MLCCSSYLPFSPFFSFSPIFFPFRSFALLFFLFFPFLSFSFLFFSFLLFLRLYFYFLLCAARYVHTCGSTTVHNLSHQYSENSIFRSTHLPTSRILGNAIDKRHIQHAFTHNNHNGQNIESNRQQETKNFQ